MAEQAVTLEPGESQVVTFEFIPEEEKVYQVSVDGLTESFTAMPRLVWNAPSGINNARSLVYDGYIYVGALSGVTYSPVVAKLDTNLNLIKMYNPRYPGRSSDQHWAYSIAAGGGYIWAGIFRLVKMAPAIVLKINPYQMQHINIPTDSGHRIGWIGTNGTMTGENWAMCLTYLDGYIYVGVHSFPASISKVNATTMTTEKRWQHDIANENVTFSLTNDGTYIYAGLESTPARVLKIDPVTMDTIASWRGIEGEQDMAIGLALDSSLLYVYVGNIYPEPNTMQPRIIVLEKATLEEVGYMVIPEYRAVNGGGITIVGDKLYLVARIDTRSKVVAIDKYSLIKAGEMDLYKCNAQGITSDGQDLFIACQDVPAKVVKLPLF